MSNFKASDYISKESLLEQCAEEATELAHAALKLARKLRNENPTPKSQEDILENLVEECADVWLCITELVEAGFFSYDAIDSEMIFKQDRWKKRINENKSMQELSSGKEG